MASRRTFVSTAARRFVDKGLTAALLLVAAGAAAAADPPAPCANLGGNGDGFYDVTVDLATGMFDKVLDFDRPIRICGELPQGTSTIQLQYAQARTSLTIDRAAACAISSAKDGKAVPLLPARPIEALIDTADNQFFALVPALPPNHYFAFCFSFQKPVSPDEATEFAARARAVVDRELGAVTSGNLDEAQAKDLATSLQQQLLIATGGGRVVEAPPLFIDPARGGQALAAQGTDLNRLIVGVLEPQRQRQLTLFGGQGGRGLAADQNDLRQLLDAIRQDPNLAGLAKAIDAKAATDAGVAAFLRSIPQGLDASYRDGLDLATLDADSAMRLALGTASAPGTPGKPATLFDSTDPAVAGQAAASWGRTSQRLEVLQLLVSNLLGASPPIAGVAPTGDAEVAALTALAADSGSLQRAADVAFTLAGKAGQVAQALPDRAAALDRFVAQLRALAREVRVAAGSSSIAYNSLQSVYVSADAGLAYVPEIDELARYVGTNIYLRPINKDVPLSQADSFLHRFSITVGLTVGDSLADDDAGGRPRSREDLFGSQNLLLGAGLRFNRVMRIGVGAMVFKEQDPNPLVDELSVAVSPYLTISFDLNVAKAFQGGFSNLFTPGG